MNIILDTNVFLKMCAGMEECGNVHSKIIRDCDRVAIDEKVIEEYSKVLHDQGFNSYLVNVRLQELDLHHKLFNASNKVRRLEDIVTHEKDRHIVECAHATRSIIITYEGKHFHDHRDEFKLRLNLEV